MSLEWGTSRRTSRHLASLDALFADVLGDCGHDMGDDPHDANELGDTQVCHSCCPSCSSEAVRPASDDAPAGPFLPAGAAVDGGLHPVIPAGDAAHKQGRGVPAINSTSFASPSLEDNHE